MGLLAVFLAFLLGAALGAIAGVVLGVLAWVELGKKAEETPSEVDEWDLAWAKCEECPEDPEKCYECPVWKLEQRELERDKAQSVTPE